MADQILSQSGPATAEQAAALHFEPWGDAGGWSPPSDSEWSDMMMSHLTTLRAACIIMRRTKEQITSAMVALDDAAGLELFERINDAATQFEELASILRNAECRLVVAGSVLELAAPAS